MFPFIKMASSWQGYHTTVMDPFASMRSPQLLSPAQRQKRLERTWNLWFEWGEDITCSSASCFSSTDEFVKPHIASGGGKVISAELFCACFRRLEGLNFAHLIRMFLHMEPSRASNSYRPIALIWKDPPKVLTEENNEQQQTKVADFMHMCVHVCP